MTVRARRTKTCSVRTLTRGCCCPGRLGVRSLSHTSAVVYAKDLSVVSWLKAI